MPLPLLAVAAYASAAAANPLIGTWLGEPAFGRDRPIAALQPSMTITPNAILFASGKRELGVAPISTFEQAGSTLLVRTRLGEVYRFRFTGADRLCRVTGIAPDRAAECFSRSRDRA